MANLRIAASRAIVVCALFLLSAPAMTEPQNGWWWNPNESGRGYFIEMTGGVFYLAGYFYESDGRATWMSASGAVTDLYSITGTLQSYRNGQSIFGAYRRPDPAVDVGPITINFADDSHGTMTWPGGTVSIERQVFDADESLEDLAKTGWWWNPAESGSGYSVEIQGNTLFVVAFMYDESGNPLWYLTAGALSSPTHFEGDWLEYSGGQTIAGPYRAPTSRNLGRVAVDFTSVNQGTITFMEGAKAKRLQQGLKKSKAAPRTRGPNPIGVQLPPPTWTEDQYWPHFYCYLNRKITAVTEAGTTGKFTLTETTRHSVQFDYLKGSLGRYKVNDAGSSLDYWYNTVDTSNGCTESAQVLDFKPLFGDLNVNPYGLFYSGRIVPTITPLVEVTVSGGDGCGVSHSRAAVVEFAMNSRGSTIQTPSPYPNSPSPYMSVRNSHTEDDGSSIEWAWDCFATRRPVP